MIKAQYELIENYMKSCMEDSSHDREHIYRVLYTALDIAKTEECVNMDVLISACLLHDIGRKEQFEDPRLCHAKVGGKKAFDFLIRSGFEKDFSLHVKSCIETHRFRKDRPPESLEAKILFDADKLDAVGAIGIARTLLYVGQVSEPLYCIVNCKVSPGENDPEHSFFTEYKYKLEKLYDHFYTARGALLAAQRRQAAVDFYNNLYSEVSSPYELGQTILPQYIG